MKSPALEKAVAAACKRDYDGKVLKVVLFKNTDGSCVLHYELWMQAGTGRSFSGPLHARGGSSAQHTPISCEKAESPAPAKASPKKKK